MKAAQISFSTLKYSFLTFNKTYPFNLYYYKLQSFLKLKINNKKNPSFVFIYSAKWNKQNQNLFEKLDLFFLKVDVFNRWLFVCLFTLYQYIEQRTSHCTDFFRFFKYCCYNLKELFLRMVYIVTDHSIYTVC